MNSSRQPEIDPKKALQVAFRRRQFLETFLMLRREGMSLNGAARLLKKSPSTFSGRASWLARYLAHGLPALVPGGFRTLARDTSYEKAQKESPLEETLLPRRCVEAAQEAAFARNRI